MSTHAVEALLRPAVELYSTVAAWSAAALSLLFPSTLMMTPPVAWGSASVFFLFGLWRARQAWRVLRYRRGLRHIPRYLLKPQAVPSQHRSLFLGQGFLWTQVHAQRLWDATRPWTQRYLRPPWHYRLARTIEERYAPLQSLLSKDTRFNPFRPLPPVGGNPALHSVGLPEGEREVRLPEKEREAHIFIAGTPGVGKTEAGKLFVTQDIRRGGPVVFFDPKGSASLLRTMYGEAKRAGREFLFFHLGYPEASAAYNPIGRFSRITEVATRLANPLPREGNAEAFRQFAWLFSNTVARAATALGEKPNYALILRYMNHIEPLLVRYFEYWLDKEGPPDWRQRVQQHDGEALRLYGKGRGRRAAALVHYVKERDLFDPVADGLRRAWEYEKSFFDKISLAIQPLLEKALSGPVGALLNPDYGDTQRPVLDWEAVVRRNAVVYVGLDALSDPEIAAMVAQAMIADLVAYAGHIYKHGVGYGLPAPAATPQTYVHMDEVSELVHGPEIVQALNKGREAGFRFALYAQTLADIEVGLGSRAKAEQLSGNITNTIVMMRVADQSTAMLLTDRLDEVEINSLMLETGTTDTTDISSSTHFVSSTRERFSTKHTPAVTPAQVMKLPKGQAFVLKEGGQLFKVRIPLIDASGERLPPALEAVASDMQRRYRSGAHWAYFEPCLDLSPFAKTKAGG